MLSNMDAAPYAYRPAYLTYACSHPITSTPGPKTPNLHNDSQNTFHQWPWRSLAFASDLGIIAHILKKPKWAGLGWMISIPYYVASLISRPTNAKRKEEALYQLTANGLFPFLSAHIGILTGERLRERLAPTVPLLLKAQPKLIWKGGSALLAMAALTPTVGDRLSDKILEFAKI